MKMRNVALAASQNEMFLYFISVNVESCMINSILIVITISASLSSSIIICDICLLVIYSESFSF